MCVLLRSKYFCGAQVLHLDGVIGNEVYGDKTLGRVRLRKKKIPLSLGPS